MNSNIFWTWIFTSWLLLGVWVHYKIFQTAFYQSNAEQTVIKD